MITIDEIKKTEIQKKINTDADKETTKANAKQKLIDLGLTEDEVKTLTGI